MLKYNLEIITYQVENCLTTYDPHAFVLVYSITDRDSFKFAEEILKYLWQESCIKEKVVILVGNKVDLARSRNIRCEGKNINYFLHFITLLAGDPALLVFSLKPVDFGLRPYILIRYF